MADTEMHETEVVHTEPVPTFMPSDQPSAEVLEMEGLSDAPKSFGRLAWERFLHHKLAIVHRYSMGVFKLGTH